MFEAIRGLPPDGIGCNGLELTFQAGLKPDPAFVASALTHFRGLRWTGDLPSPALSGLADEVEACHATLQLQHDSTGTISDLALFGAALASTLMRRLGGGETVLDYQAGPATATIRFEPADGFLHSFALLYSVNFLHYTWREGAVEPRLDQLLELAEVFFGQEAAAELDSLPTLDRVFPQETLNSFVNLVHPQARSIGRQLTKILLLEDNRELGEIVADMLASCGYVVCQAPDGMSGLNRLERERFQLILSDIQMPRLNGMGLLKVLHKRHLKIPVILTTGYTGIWQEDQALKQGAVAFLPKPFGMEELIRTVDRALAGQGLSHSL
ncbi:MAG: response regulator [bacterium]|jgi:CheY-like chemotaxis protein|nr:response regulator [bacterium]